MQERTNSNPNTYFPLGILTTSREEYYGQDDRHQPLQLTIRDRNNHPTELPEDLQGHVYILSPVGSVASESVDEETPHKVIWSSKDGWTPFFNGDGMVYRLSFNNGGASLKTRIVKPPCYYADLATYDRSKTNPYRDLAFNDLGVSRVSFDKIGARNQLNTAFLVFKTKEDKSDRLLLTWDVGRPHEIDPETLETLQPVGKNRDWENMLYSKVSLPFKLVMTSAHPVFDPNTNEVFTINVGKSLWTMLGLYRSIKERVAENAKSLQDLIKNSSLPSEVQLKLLTLYKCLLGLISSVVNLVGKIEKIGQVFTNRNFVRLFLWDGKQVDIAQTWQVLLPGQRPLIIEQTVHQMGLTEKYILIGESAFKFSLENILPYQRDFLSNDFKILLADFINYNQFPYTKLYIVKRQDLKKSLEKKSSFWSKLFPKKLPIVIAKEVEIRPEFFHYAADYENPDNKIILHVAHAPALDIAEYIRIFDRSIFDDRDRDNEEDRYDDARLSCRLQKLAGNVVAAMDISRVGCWKIDGETAEIIDSDTTFEPDINWSTSFYANFDNQPTNKLTDLYWNSWGAWPDLLTVRIKEQYENYPQSQRQIPVEEVLEKTYQGMPSSLCHLKIDSTDKVKLEIIDRYQFKDPHKSNKHYVGTSAQFVPSTKASDNPQTNGYIVCIVLTSDNFFPQSDDDSNDPNWSQNSEIWIFDAQDLESGPLYKLSHPQLNLGFTTHTTWLKEAKSPTHKINYDVREDHDYLIAQQPEKVKDLIQQLFDREVYPNFPKI
jgi:carotenoid cleavage dioxygenase-like enzyme